MDSQGKLDPIATFIFFPRCDIGSGLFTMSTFEPLVYKPNFDMCFLDWWDTQVSLYKNQLPP